MTSENAGFFVAGKRIVGFAKKCIDNPLKYTVYRGSVTLKPYF